MTAFRTDDGFEYESARDGRAIRCTCRRDGHEVSVTVDCGCSSDPEAVQIEQVELVARSAWIADERIRRRGDLGRPADRDRKDQDLA